MAVGAEGVVAGAIKGIALGLQVMLGMDKPQKESHDEAQTKPVDDRRLAAAKRLHANVRSKDRA